jgi:TctA family transporter
MADILDACLNGLIQLFSWKPFALQLVGIAIGFMVGILPGLGGPVTLALMLPFIFTMTPVEAFSFLLGMTAVTATTGDITSILFGVPGEPITASMVVDGIPWRRKEAGAPSGAALMSSLWGDFGALCLAISIRSCGLWSVRRVAQYFMLAMLGMAFLASLTGDSVTKGLVAACLGLLFALVGLDPISGTERYTFETLYLWDGIRLVPATLGLFAIPEIIGMAIAGTSIAKADVGKIGGVLQGVKDTFRHWALVLRCSALGAYIGILPGVGGGTSQWVSYAHAVQSSRDKDRFGKGAVEGVLAPGAGTHSTLGGDMVPTVAFGIPGSVSTAILLGAFIIQGLVPGPSMLTPEAQGGHLSLTFSFVWIIVVSNIITTAICFLFLAQIAKVTQVRSSLVLPFILLLIYIGAFAENNAFGDVVTMLAVGALGWVMVQTDWPRPPLIWGWCWRAGGTEPLSFHRQLRDGLARFQRRSSLCFDGAGDLLPAASAMAGKEKQAPVQTIGSDRGTSGQGSQPGLDLVLDLQSVCGRPVRVGAVAGLELGFPSGSFSLGRRVLGFTARVPSVESGYCRRCQNDRPRPGQGTRPGGRAHHARDRQNLRLDTGLLCRHLVAWIFRSHSGYDFSLPQAGERAMAHCACSHVFRLGFLLRPVCLLLACAVSRRPAVCLVWITVFFS